MKTNNNSAGSRLSLHDIMRNFDEHEETTQPVSNTYGRDGYSTRQDSAAWGAGHGSLGWGLSRPAPRPPTPVYEDIELSSRGPSPAPEPDADQISGVSIDAQSEAGSAQGETGGNEQVGKSSTTAAVTDEQGSDADKIDAQGVNSRDAATKQVQKKHQGSLSAAFADVENNRQPAIMGANPGFWARRTRGQKALIGVAAGLVIAAVAGGVGASVGHKSSGSAAPAFDSTATASQYFTSVTPFVTPTVTPAVTQFSSATRTLSTTTSTTPMSHTAYPTLEAGTFSVACWATVNMDAYSHACSNLVESVTAIFDTWTISPPKATGAQVINNESGMIATLDAEEDEDAEGGVLVVAADFVNGTFLDMGPNAWRPQYSNGSGSTGYWRLEFYKNGSVDGGMLLIAPGSTFDNSDCEFDTRPTCVPNKIG